MNSVLGGVLGVSVTPPLQDIVLYKMKLFFQYLSISFFQLFNLFLSGFWSRESCGSCRRISSPSPRADGEWGDIGTPSVVRSLPNLGGFTQIIYTAQSYQHCLIAWKSLQVDPCHRFQRNDKFSRAPTTWAWYGFVWCLRCLHIHCA